jgi:phenol/toluene 2-monooxygenase (NADH) P4/A4
MSVKAISEYITEPKDTVANFNGMQVLYVYWEKHLMFCSPFALLVSPEMTLGAFFDEVLRPAIAAHPDSAQVDFSQAQWRLNDQPFIPDLGAGLLAQGIDHKSMLTLTTPGLTGIKGCAS